nr:phosphodiesterase [Actinomycetales bacterium]
MRAVSSLRTSLHRDLQRGGFYPELVSRVLEVAIGGQEVVSYLVHPETSFDSREIYRHLTALVLTPTRLVGVHVDDDPERPSRALATTEAVALSRIKSVVLSHGVSDPARSDASVVDELTIAVNWGAVSRVDLEPASCPDPNCEADHGYTGAVTGEDLVIRVSAPADGQVRLDQALAFARALSAGVARSSEQ